MKLGTIVAAALGVAMLAVPAAMADQTFGYGWEDGGTILDQYGNLDSFNVTDPVHSGQHSLKLVDQSSSGPSTPQAYVAWITGLVEGDTVDASFWRYDDTPGSSPSTRIWGHWTEPGSMDYSGSAGGNSDYGPGTGWDQTSNTWTFDADGGVHNGIVIEVRSYSNDGDTHWIDDIEVVIPDHASVVFAPEPATMALLAIGGLALIRRR